MKKIYNKIIPFKGWKAINLFGILFVREGAKISEKDENHEAIHTEQMKELLFVFFYIFYFIEWLFKLFIHLFNVKSAYRNISFEKEAYGHQSDLTYLENRKRYNWFKLIWK